MVKCANCHQSHTTVQEVKDCHMLGAQPQPGAYAAARQTAQAAPGATEKQLAYLAALLADRPAYADVNNLHPDVIAKFTKAEASQQISQAKASPKEAKPQAAQAQAPDLEDGVYRMEDGTLYKVVHALHGSGKQYAKVLHVIEEHDERGNMRGGASWEYAGRKPLHQLTPAMRLTAEAAKEFGLLYGVCVRCCRDLTREESIHVGYGKVCARHEGWWYPTKKELAALSTKEVSA